MYKSSGPAVMVVLPDFNEVAVRVAHVAADFCRVPLRLGDEFRSARRPNLVAARMFRYQWNRAFGMRFSTDLAIAGLQVAGQARIVVAVQPLELLLGPT